MPHIHAAVFAMLLLCYGGLRKPEPKFASPHTLQFSYSFYSVLWVSATGLGCIFNEKKINEKNPFVQFNLNLTSGLRKLDRIHPHTLLYLLWYSHKPHQLTSTFDIATLWLCYRSVQLKCPIHATVFTRVYWTIK